MTFFGEFEPLRATALCLGMRVGDSLCGGPTKLAIQTIAMHTLTSWAQLGRLRKVRMSRLATYLWPIAGILGHTVLIEIGINGTIGLFVVICCANSIVDTEFCSPYDLAQEVLGQKSLTHMSHSRCTNISPTLYDVKHDPHNSPSPRKMRGFLNPRKPTGWPKNSFPNQNPSMLSRKRVYLSDFLYLLSLAFTVSYTVYCVLCCCVPDTIRPEYVAAKGTKAYRLD
ncbi:hypothetical protein DL96DRAFT_373205 [Flagelloscypha sp. PMI_526]|nr:hypothetical protein DL96DRAFT_373205 [Flagelloscypha sp. PMI_526]